MGAAASFPDKLNKEQAQQLCGDQFDEERFDAFAEDGLVEKETLLLYAEEPVEGAEAVVIDPAQAETSGTVTKEQAEADAQADM